MAEPIYLQDDGAWLDEQPGRRLPVVALLAVLLLALPVLRHRQRETRMAHLLRRGRPGPDLVLWGLEQEDPERLGDAIRALDQLPPRLVGEILEAAPLGRGGALDHAAAPLLRRRGDAVARRLLARLESVTSR